MGFASGPPCFFYFGNPPVGKGDNPRKDGVIWNVKTGELLDSVSVRLGV